jgi:hypothetical protein
MVVAKSKSLVSLCSRERRDERFVHISTLKTFASPTLYSASRRRIARVVPRFHCLDKRTQQAAFPHVVRSLRQKLPSIVFWICRFVIVLQVQGMRQRAESGYTGASPDSSHLHFLVDCIFPNDNATSQLIIGHNSPFTVRRPRFTSSTSSAESVCLLALRRYPDIGSIAHIAHA